MHLLIVIQQVSLNEFKNKLKKVKDELGFIIEDIDYKFRKEFYGEEK